MLPRHISPSPRSFAQIRSKTRIAFRNKAGSVLLDHKFVDTPRPPKLTTDGKPKPPRAPKPPTTFHPSQIPLPSEKLRSLVSLYHASSSFITPETLDDAIDYAFIHSKTNELGLTSGTMDIDEQQYSELYTQMVERRTAEATTAEWGQSSHAYSSNAGTEWSGKMTDREKRVIEALYGTDTSGNAGLGTLEDESSRENVDTDSTHNAFTFAADIAVAKTKMRARGDQDLKSFKTTPSQNS